MAGAIFELKQVYYSYLEKIPALSAIDLTIEKGSKVAIIGANGTGKSTLLLMLDALIFPNKGSVKAFGKELNESLLNELKFSRFFRSKVGFVFQNSDIQLFCPTVKEDIMFGPLQLGVPKIEIKKRLDKLSERIKIKELLERAPHQLSVGEKKRVAIASVLIMEPEVLILDEPTAGLDPQTVRSIIDIIIEENNKGKTIVSSTQDLHIIEEIADIVHVFNTDKTIVRSAVSRDLLSDLEFLKANNLMHVHKHHHKDTIHTHPHQHIEHHH